MLSSIHLDPNQFEMVSQFFLNITNFKAIKPYNFIIAIVDTNSKI